jgi:hypothetical protein
VGTSRRRELRSVSGWEEQRRARRILDRYVVPLTEGSADDESNLAPIHEDCHRCKTHAEARRARA